MAYATLSEIKDYLGISETDTSHDTLLTYLLDRASDLIDKYCQRKFITNDEARKFKVTQNSENLFIPDLLSVTTLKIDDSVVSSDNFELCPLDAPSKSEPFRWIQLKSGLFRKNSIVEIDGTWGYWTEVPDPINFACLLWTTRLFRKKDQPGGKIASESIGDYSVNYAKGEEAVIEPPQEILESFRKREIFSF